MRGSDHARVVEVRHFPDPAGSQIPYLHMNLPAYDAVRLSRCLAVLRTNVGTLEMQWLEDLLNTALNEEREREHTGPQQRFQQEYLRLMQERPITWDELRKQGLVEPKDEPYSEQIKKIQEKYDKPSASKEVQELKEKLKERQYEAIPGLEKTEGLFIKEEGLVCICEYGGGKLNPNCPVHGWLQDSADPTTDEEEISNHERG